MVLLTTSIQENFTFKKTLIKFCSSSLLKSNCYSKISNQFCSVQLLFVINVKNLVLSQMNFNFYLLVKVCSKEIHKKVKEHINLLFIFIYLDFFLLAKNMKCQKIVVKEYIIFF